MTVLRTIAVPIAAISRLKATAAVTRNGSLASTSAAARGALAVGLAAVLAACVSQPRPTASQQAGSPLPTYRDGGVDLLAGTRGILYRAGSCVLLQSSDQTLVPVWPRGTEVTANGLTLPAANGGAFLRFGRLTYLYGGHLHQLNEESLRSLPQAASAASCGTHGFIVNRAETQEALEAAAPRPPSTGGRLVQREKCLVVETPEGVVLPIWPKGTQVTGKTVVTPNLRGRRPVEIGGLIGIEGRYVHADDGSLQAAAGADAANCASRGMNVENARRLFVPGNAAELAAESEAVLLIRIDAIDFSDPRSDGFLTTLNVTVLEPLKGPYRAGDPIRVRHALGQDASGHWQLTAHSGHFASSKPGDQLLLFVNREFYIDQAAARGGQPLPGHVGAGGGLFRVVDGKIVIDTDIEMPDTLRELRTQVRGR